MRKMKNSGIAWIGEIPNTWTTSRIKYVADFEPKCDFSIISDDTNIEYAPMECIKYGQFEKRTARFGTLASSLTPFQDGDIVMAKVTPCFENGNIAIMDDIESGIGLGSSELFVFRAKAIEKEYLFFWLQNQAFIQQACSTMTGTGGLKRVSPYFVKNCEIHLPPIPEQIIIASFLERRCVEIDSVIAQTCASIEEYKHLKQAVITQTVTKGVRGDRPMKESGIEWIGKIPEDWNLGRIGEIYTERRTKVSDTEYPPLSVTMKGIVPQLSTAAKTDAHDDRKLVCKGDFAINSRSDRRGSCGISAYDGSVSLINTILKPRKDMNPRYYDWLFHTTMFADEFYKWGHGIVDDLWTTNWQDMKNIFIPVPSTTEQQIIASYLDEKCTETDALIAKKEQLLTELESYKKSLIYEYVTGKKEVTP